jgi:hypothetical protein
MRTPAGPPPAVARFGVAWLVGRGGREDLARVGIGLALTIAVFVAGCGSPRYGDCEIRCGQGEVCPSGLDCGLDGFCYREPPGAGGERCAAGADASSSGDAGGAETFAWSAVVPVAGSPEPSTNHAMAYDPVRAQVVLFGGVNGSGRHDETWLLAGSRWTRVTPTTGSPPRRSNHAMAYDPASERVLLFGGIGFDDAGIAVDLDDTWAWDGETWTEVTPNVGSPDARARHAMAYDPGRERVVLFGGQNGALRLGDTWEWDGAAWTEVTPPAGSPEPRVQPAMAYCRQTERVVLFGGENPGTALDNKTWAWDGARWAEVAPAAGSPPQTGGHAMASDLGRGRIVLFGGFISGARDDTWEWDGTAWIEVTPPAGSPGPRHGHAMAYDSAGEGVVVFGGFDGDGDRLGDTWLGHLAPDE